MSEMNLTASDERTAEDPSVPVGKKDNPVLERETLSIGLDAPPPFADEELLEPQVGFWRRHRLFIVTVVLPMAAAAVFLFFVLAPRYSSTVAFMVRPTDRSASAEDQNILTEVVNTAGETEVDTIEPYEVTAFLTSRDVVDLLAKNDDLRGILSRPQADFVFRYPTFWLPDNNELLYRRFLWAAKTDLDPLTGIITIEANAFTPQDAQALCQAMLRYAEARVNQMNQHFYQSEVATADRFVAEAEKDVGATESRAQGLPQRFGIAGPQSRGTGGAECGPGPRDSAGAGRDLHQAADPSGADIARSPRPSCAGQRLPRRT